MAPEITKNTRSDESRPGLVIVNYGKNQLVEDASGDIYRCVARRGLPQIVCGDEVEWQPTGESAGVIETILPRRTVLLRADGNHKSRPLVTNIDQVIIEAALEPALDYFLIDKYIVAADLAQAEPLIVINKSDLIRPEDRSRIEALISEYSSIGYTTLLTSALENTGIKAFSDGLVGKTSILVGQSGVGKSSLIRRLLPDRDITIGRLSAASGLGKHTTTSTTLYHLPHGGKLIDSPGVRDFYLGRIADDELGNGFCEFRPYLGQCKFNDCRHLSEPGCVINAAVADGNILKRRMESYRRLQQSDNNKL
ncbi:MAG: ribosome small subunit-dependent GTPase A [Gammaproteobacteria bacterium]|nr:ribosome small subunit-dependent GTPase A [Gammaproteobacteria bacterium]